MKISRFFKAFTSLVHRFCGWKKSICSFVFCNLAAKINRLQFCSEPSYPIASSALPVHPSIFHHNLYLSIITSINQHEAIIHRLYSSKAFHHHSWPCTIHQPNIQEASSSTFIVNISVCLLVHRQHLSWMKSFHRPEMHLSYAGHETV